MRRGILDVLRERVADFPAAPAGFHLRFHTILHHTQGTVLPPGDTGQTPFSWPRPDGFPEKSDTYLSPARLLRGWTVHTWMANIGGTLTKASRPAPRHLLPPDARGTFQGIRLIFMVLAPMVIGPAIGSALIRVFGRPAMIEGRAGHLPPSLIYLVSALVIAATLVPVWLLHRRRGGRPPGARRLSAG